MQYPGVERIANMGLMNHAKIKVEDSKYMTVKIPPWLANLKYIYTCSCSSEFSEHVPLYFVWIEPEIM